MTDRFDEEAREIIAAVAARCEIDRGGGWRPAPQVVEIGPESISVVSERLRRIAAEAERRTMQTAVVLQRRSERIERHARRYLVSGAECDRAAVWNALGYTPTESAAYAALPTDDDSATVIELDPRYER